MKSESTTSMLFFFLVLLVVGCNLCACFRRKLAEGVKEVSEMQSKVMNSPTGSLYDSMTHKSDRPCRCIFK